MRALRTGDAYARMIAAPPAKRADFYRHELMAPLKAKWDCYHVPLHPAQPGGYDVVMASEMLGILPPARVDGSWADAVRRLADEELWRSSQQAVERALARFVERGIELRVQDYLFSILLGDPDNPALAASDGYCGDGGIPGYVLAWLVPNDDTVPAARRARDEPQRTLPVRRLARRHYPRRDDGERRAGRELRRQPVRRGERRSLGDEDERRRA
ncbi:MAG: DUF2268 domain-containing putative Zn-dependent protease [Eggerthella lenta]